MAYITKPKADEENTKPIQNLGDSGPATLGTGASVISQGGGGQTNKAPTASGSFVNLQNYLDTNKPQAAQLGTNVANSVAKRGTDAMAAVDQAKSTFNTQVQTNTPTLNQGLVDKAVASPTSFNDANDTASWNKMLSGTYSGPTVAGSTELWSPASTAIKQAADTSNLVKTAGGQTELLRQIAPNPYSRGGMSMNQMLLQNTDEARDKVYDASNALAPLGTVMDKTLSEADQAVQQAQKTAADTRAGLIGKIAGTGGALEGYQVQVNQKLEQAKAEDAVNLSKIDAIINGIAPLSTIDNSVRTTLDRMGWNENALNDIATKNQQLRSYGQQDLTGVNSKAVLPQNANYLKAGDVASNEDIARYRALNNLIGNQGKDINLEKGTKTQSYNDAINTLNQQVQTYSNRKTAMVAEQAAMGSAIANNLKNAGYVNTGGSSSDSFVQGDEANWVDPYTGRTFGNQLYDFISENPKIANSVVNNIANAMVPGAGFLLGVLNMFGIDTARAVGNLVGLEPYGSVAALDKTGVYTPTVNTTTLGGVDSASGVGAPLTGVGTGFNSAEWGTGSSKYEAAVAPSWSPAMAYSSPENGGTGTTTDYGGLNTGAGSGFDSGNWGGSNTTETDSGPSYSGYSESSDSTW